MVVFSIGLYPLLNRILFHWEVVKLKGQDTEWTIEKPSWIKMKI